MQSSVKNKLVLYLLLFIGLFQSIYAYSLSFRQDEAYLYLKSQHLAWQNSAFSGTGELILYFAGLIDKDPLTLRTASIILTILSAYFVYKLTCLIFNKRAGFVALVTFLVLPSTSYAIVSATPNGALMFFSVLSIYYSYMALQNKSIKTYLISFIFSMLAFLTDFSGLIFLIIPIIYIIIYRKELNISYLYLLILGKIVVILTAFLLHYFGLFQLLYKYPLILNGDKMPLYIISFITMLPILYIVFILIKYKNDLNSSIKFISIFFIVLTLWLICLIFIIDFDARNISALLIPAIILTGCFYEQYGYKVFAGIIITILALVSFYTKVYNDKYLTPEYLKGNKVYESLQNQLSSIDSNINAIFTDNAGLSSVIAYYSITSPEACTVEDCSLNEGIFISLNKKDNLLNDFESISESGIYRIFNAQGDKFSFYFYKVKGLKNNQK